MSVSRVLFQGGVGATAGAIGAGALSALGVINPGAVGQIALASGLGNAALTAVVGSTVATYGLFGSALTPLAKNIVRDDTPMLKFLLTNPLWPAIVLSMREMLGSAAGVGILLALSQSTAPLSQTVAASGVGGAGLSLGINLTVGVLISLGMRFAGDANQAAAELAYSTFKAVGGP